MAWSTLADLIWPPCCQRCGRGLVQPGFDVLCAGCWRACLDRSAGPRCPCCGLARPRGADPGRCLLCRRRPRAWRAARHGALYEGPLQELMPLFKYEGRSALVRPLARLALRAARTLPLDLARIDGLLAVPMDPWQRLRRGYNPAALIAGELARRLERPLLRGLLRGRRGPRQAVLSRLERLANVRRRFAAGRRRPPAVVLLVDDVWTTGATSNHCALLLRQAGAQEVYLVTAARRL